MRLRRDFGFDRKVIILPTGMSHTVAQSAVVYSERFVPVGGAQVFHIRKRAHCRARKRNTLHVSHIIIVVVVITILHRYTIPTYYCYDDDFDKLPLIRPGGRIG